MCIILLEYCHFLAGETHYNYFFSTIWEWSVAMCKKDNKAAMPGGQENNNVNVGLLNMKNSGKTWQGRRSWHTLSQPSASSCASSGWRNAGIAGRKGGQQPMVNLGQGRHQPMAMQQMRAQQLALPAPLPVIVHPNQFKLPVLEGNEDRMEKYRTQGTYKHWYTLLNGLKN